MLFAAFNQSPILFLSVFVNIVCVVLDKSLVFFSAYCKIGISLLFLFLVLNSTSVFTKSQFGLQNATATRQMISAEP